MQMWAQARQDGRAAMQSGGTLKSPAGSGGKKGKKHRKKQQSGGKKGKKMHDKTIMAVFCMFLIHALCIPGDFNGQPFPGSRSASKMLELCHEHAWMAATKDMFLRIVGAQGLKSIQPLPQGQANVGAAAAAVAAAPSLLSGDGDDDDEGGDALGADEALAELKAAVDDDMPSDEDGDDDGSDDGNVSASGGGGGQAGSRRPPPWEQHRAAAAVGDDGPPGLFRRALGVLYRQSVRPNPAGRLPPIFIGHNSVYPLPPQPSGVNGGGISGQSACLLSPNGTVPGYSLQGLGGGTVGPNPLYPSLGLNGGFVPPLADPAYITPPPGGWVQQQQSFYSGGGSLQPAAVTEVGGGTTRQRRGGCFSCLGC